MNKEKVKTTLSGLFVPRAKGLEGVCFNSECMKPESEQYAVYQAVSEAQRESGLTFDFSYAIANYAVDILAEAEDWEELAEEIDAALPVYTSEIMEIYQGNAWAVDEAVKELGAGEDSGKNALLGWYCQITTMAEAIKNNLAEVIEEDETA